MTHDYSDHVAAPTQQAFKKLNEAVTNLATESDEVERLEEELKFAKLRAQDLAERVLPEIMEEMGLTDFTTTSGVKIALKETVHASITKAKQAAAMTWLDDNGHGGLIKRHIRVAFDRSQTDDAESLLQELSGRFVNTACDMKVESSTLRAWVREQLEAGAPIDQDLFGVHVRKVVKID